METREITLRKIDWEHIEHLSILHGLTVDKFLLKAVAEYQNPDKEPVKVRKGNEGFDEFWKTYPRKVGVAAARKAWGRVRYQENFIDLVLGSLERQKRSLQWQDRQYIPLPATWLNQHRWLDEEESNQMSWLERRQGARK